MACSGCLDYKYLRYKNIDQARMSTVHTYFIAFVLSLFVLFSFLLFPSSVLCQCLHPIRHFAFPPICSLSRFTLMVHLVLSLPCNSCVMLYFNALFFSLTVLSFVIR